MTEFVIAMFGGSVSAVFAFQVFMYVSIFLMLCLLGFLSIQFIDSLNESKNTTNTSGVKLYGILCVIIAIPAIIMPPYLSIVDNNISSVFEECSQTLTSSPIAGTNGYSIQFTKYCRNREHMNDNFGDWQYVISSKNQFQNVPLTGIERVGED